MSAVPPEELQPPVVQQRVAILKRFRELLKSQRDRFKTYLDTLESQKKAIENGSADEIVSHVDLEEQIVADIFSIQKVIDPLNDMYRALAKSGENDDVPDLKAALEGLRTEAAARSKRNQELLSRRMTTLNTEIASARPLNPYRGKSLYTQTGAGTVIDIRG
ncbi:hypothetical protein AGMMS49928_19750 [Spirochaetia bacterium]|nr:hypothetical protein AGMMS49928_19750 [Spirochaetia bacterium]